MANVSIRGDQLQGVITALRACGDTRIPMKIALRMSGVQKKIVERLQESQELNNKLIERYGEPSEHGQHSVGPEMKEWNEYLVENRELNDQELDLGEPFVLYEKGDEYGWTADVKTPVVITANVITDMDILLEIREEGWNTAPEEEPEPEVIGHIEPTE